MSEPKTTSINIQCAEVGKDQLDTSIKIETTDPSQLRDIFSELPKKLVAAKQNESLKMIFSGLLYGMKKHAPDDVLREAAADAMARDLIGKLKEAFSS